MPIEFKEGGSGYTLGVEEELHIVDATTGELVQKIEEIMSRLPAEASEASQAAAHEPTRPRSSRRCLSASATEAQGGVLISITDWKSS